MAGGDERITVTEAGRLDAVLAAASSVGSRRRAKQMIGRGKVSVDGVDVDPEETGRAVPAGAVVVIHWNRPGTTRKVAQGRRALGHVGLSILWDDGHLVAVDKPPGLLTDAATHRQRREEDTVRSRLDAWLRPQGARAWPCHRIDRDTSGVVLFAREEAVAQAVRAQLAERTPERVYEAFVEGVPLDDRGRWTDWMAWDPQTRRQEIVAPGTEGAVEAWADWEVVERWDQASWLRIRLGSGRRNQIRVHLGGRRMPLIGERQYRPEGCRPVTRRMGRQALHAGRLVVRDPVGGGEVVFEAGLPRDMVGIRKVLGGG